MAAEIHISAVCTISDHTVSQNGEVLFTSDETDVQSFLVDAYKHFQSGYARFYKMDTLSKLGWMASEVLLKDFDRTKYQSDEVGMVLVNANASLDSDIKYIASVADIPSPALFVYTLPNIMIGEISIRNQFKGEAALFVSGKFDADFIRQYVESLFDSGIFRACICGWVDVLGNDYKAALFLVEKGEGPIAFTADNMNRYFNYEAE